MTNTANLNKVLNAYKEGSGNHYTRGDWSIAKGGYDLIFEVYYQNTPIADYTRDRYDRTDKGELDIWGDFTREEKVKIADCICKTFDIDISVVNLNEDLELEEDLENDER